MATTWQRNGGDVVRYSCAETAQFVRAALKDAFPGVKFGVRSRTYSGGASIDIKWTDGPVTKDVERVAHRFEGATFDGMIDLKEYKEATMNGQRVSFGADFIHCEREYSPEMLEKAARMMADKYGVDAPKVRASSYKGRGGKIITDYSYEPGKEPVFPGNWGTMPEYMAMKIADETEGE